MGWGVTLILRLFSIPNWTGTELANWNRAWQKKEKVTEKEKIKKEKKKELKRERKENRKQQAQLGGIS